MTELHWAHKMSAAEWAAFCQELDFERVIEVIKTIRQLKAANNIAPSTVVDVFIDPIGATPEELLHNELIFVGDQFPRILATGERYTIPKVAQDISIIERMAGTRVHVAIMHWFDTPVQPTGPMAQAVTTAAAVLMPLANLIDLDKERERLMLELADLYTQIESRTKRLTNAKYIERAPAAIVANDRETLIKQQTQAVQLDKQLVALY